MISSGLKWDLTVLFSFWVIIWRNLAGLDIFSNTVVKMIAGTAADWLNGTGKADRRCTVSGCWLDSSFLHHVYVENGLLGYKGWNFFHYERQLTCFRSGRTKARMSFMILRSHNIFRTKISPSQCQTLHMDGGTGSQRWRRTILETGCKHHSVWFYTMFLHN